MMRREFIAGLAARRRYRLLRGGSGASVRGASAC